MHWLRLSDGRAHRKLVVKSLIYFSKILLEEASWTRAVEFADFAIALIQQANRAAGRDPDEGTAMIRCNRLWARQKLGKEIRTELAAWDTSRLHKRYKLLRSVLLKDYRDGILLLNELLKDGPSGEGANLSLAEIEEWPIFEDLRKSEVYLDWRGSVAPLLGKG